MSNIPKTVEFSPLAKTDGVTAEGALVIKIDSTFNEGILSFVDASVAEPGEAVLALGGFTVEDPSQYMSIIFTERDTVNNELKGITITGGADREWPAGTEIQANPTAYLLNLIKGNLNTHIAEDDTDDVHGYKTYVNGKLSTNATATGAVTIDLNDGNVHELTLTGDVTLSVTNVSTAHVFDLIINQGETIYTVTWFDNLDWVRWAYSDFEPVGNDTTTYRYRFYTTNGGVNWQGKELWRDYWPQYHGLVKFGTLQYGAAELARPTYPWRSTHTYDGNAGNIHEFDSGDAMTDYSLINTSSTDGNVLWWHKFVIGEKTLYICDRNILANLSWDDLNSDDWVSGKSVTIDGTTYTGRLLTGGSDTRTGTGQTGDERYLGGSTPNEWDNLVLNGDTQLGAPFTNGAPTPSSGDMPYGTSLTEDNAARLSAHNQAWHWISMFSWCQEVADYDNARRVGRGYYSARYWNTDTSGYTLTNRGWRPCLEQ